MAADVEMMSGAAGKPLPVELPLHLTEKILCHISPLESARHVTVCRSWAATISARLARPVPHLFLCTPPSIESNGRGLLVSVQLDCATGGSPIPSRVRLADTTGLQCIGAMRGGRVAFASGWWSRDVVLVNPVTGSLRTIDVGKPYQLDPCRSRVLASGSDSFLTVHDHQRLTLWQRRPHARTGRTSGEEAWSECAVVGAQNLTSNIVSAVECKGVFYLSDLDGCLSKIDVTSPPPLRVEKLPVESLTAKFTTLLMDDGRMLESDGEVLFVRQRPVLNEAAANSCTCCLFATAFEVYRLDLKEQRWTRLKELPGDQALFVSPGSSFSVRASETEGCTRNCIYFAGEKLFLSTASTFHEGGNNSWGVYSMEHRKVLFSSAVTEPGVDTQLTWFLPRVVV